MADAGAQRIFRDDPGAATPFTLAGGGAPDPATFLVPGGYHDGPALAARFDRPSGIARGRDGALYVADAGNRCIRKIENGVVSTFARGFALPVSLSFGADGMLYVADYGAGVRAVAADGTVSDVAIPGLDLRLRSVAAAPGNPTTLFIATDAGLTVYVPATRGKFDFGDANEGDDALGQPAQLVAFSDRVAAFADPRSRTVRAFLYGRGTLTQSHAFSLGAQAPEDASDRAGPLVAPLGLAAEPDGSLAVADAGARRIVRMPGFLPRQAVSGIADLALPENTYRVAFISNSMAYTNVTWETSVGGTLERELNAARGRGGPPDLVRVATVRLAPANMTATAGYIEQLLAAGNFDLVVWGINDAHLSVEFGHLDGPEVWQPKVSAMLATVDASLRRAHTAFVVAYHPFAQESSWLELNWANDVSIPGAANPPDWVALAARTKAALAASGAPLIDAFPGFWEAERRPDRVPLFGTDDGHFSRAGATLFGRILASQLERLHPWANRAPNGRRRGAAGEGASR